MPKRLHAVLEPFWDSNPATVTSCKQEFNIQYILEWCQRSSPCLICWQPISLKDPISQELLGLWSGTASQSRSQFLVFSTHPNTSSLLGGENEPVSTIAFGQPGSSTTKDPIQQQSSLTLNDAST
ncbi:E3 ubiquitin-protein ligase RHF2A [Platanthera guangdongensis]|uniref:RING-type E3 ubiquitin transferase n=1 Tax=Platanthera guangdongensis TaxID=2320717 RepID=A0ABR2M3F4_9ASPA